MTQVTRAFHLRGGQRTTVDLVDGWLNQHALEVWGCADSFQACTQLLTAAGDPVQLAFLGVDWLGPDELAIVDYVRETWPRAGMVIYGSAPFGSLQAPDLAVYCGSRAALQAALDHTVDGLIAYLRRQSRRRAHSEATVSAEACDWPTVEAAVPTSLFAVTAARTPAGTAVVRNPQSVSSPEAPAKAVAPASVQSDNTEQERATDTPPEAPGSVTEDPRSILTREELAALLDGA